MISSWQHSKASQQGPHPPRYQYRPSDPTYPPSLSSVCPLGLLSCAIEDDVSSPELAEAVLLASVLGLVWVLLLVLLLLSAAGLAGVTALLLVSGVAVEVLPEPAASPVPPFSMVVTLPGPVLPSMV